MTALQLKTDRVDDASSDSLVRYFAWYEYSCSSHRHTCTCIPASRHCFAQASVILVEHINTTM